ncbi:MAG: response regulator [Ferruginibacter sp.]
MTHKLNCILLVDDDEPTNFISNMLLEEAACCNHIQVEESGKAALEYLTQSNRTTIDDPEGLPYPDLIFLDINMPAMNGWEFLEKYRELSPRLKKTVVIIMLTTSINPDDKLRADYIPFVSGFANKPLTSTMIRGLLREHFMINNE